LRLFRFLCLSRVTEKSWVNFREIFSLDFGKGTFDFGGVHQNWEFCSPYV